MAPVRTGDLVLLALSLVAVAGVGLLVVIAVGVLPFWWWGPPILAVTGAASMGVGLMTGPDAERPDDDDPTG